VTADNGDYDRRLQEAADDAARQSAEMWAEVAEVLAAHDQELEEWAASPAAADHALRVAEAAAAAEQFWADR